MGYRRQSAPADLDADGVRKYVEEQLLRIQRAQAELDETIAELNETITELSDAIANAGRSHGQCLLTKSGANLLLSPHNGDNLVVNGEKCTIPAAGLTLAPTSLAANTNYFIYAAATSGVVSSLEASTTAPATSTATGNVGVKIKTGDETRTLVGMARTTAAVAWVDSVTQAFVLSYFNRSGKGLENHFTATRSSASVYPTWTELHSEIRIEFLTWADEVVEGLVAGSGYPGVANKGSYIAIAFDGVSPENGMAAISDGTGGALRPCPAYASRRLSEGYHYATVIGCADSGGSINMYVIAAANGGRSALKVTVQG